MKTIKESTSQTPILSIDDSQTVLRDCRNPRTILAWKLGFHYALMPVEARGLTGEDFNWENGRPVGFRVARNDDDPSGAWFVPIRPLDQRLFAELLPLRGPLFTEKNPYTCLFRIGAAHGIRLSATVICRTCLNYAISSRCYHEHFLELAGLEPSQILGFADPAQGLRYFELLPDFCTLQPSLTQNPPTL